MFDNTESVVVHSKNEISMEGIDCIFGSLGEIRYMYRENDKKRKKIDTWICYAAHSMAMRAVEVDGEMIGGSTIKVEPAQFFIQNHLTNKSKNPGNSPNSSSYSYSDYSTNDEAEDSHSDDYIPIYPTQPLPTPVVTQQNQWPQRIEQKQESKRKPKDKKNRKMEYSSEYSESDSYESSSYSSYSSYSDYSSSSSYSSNSYESDNDIDRNKKSNRKDHHERSISHRRHHKNHNKRH